MNHFFAALDPVVHGLPNRTHQTWPCCFRLIGLVLLLLSLVDGVSRLDAADVNVIIPGGNGPFTTNIVFNNPDLGAHKTLWVAPASGYRFKAEPTTNCNSSVIMVQQTSYTPCGAMYELWLVGNHQEGTAQISGTITPGSCSGGGGGGGGGGTHMPPPDREFSIGLYLGPFIYFTVPTNGTNLTASVGSTNNLAVRVVLGDATAPASGTVTFSGSPANLGTFNPSSVALTGGVASTTFIASTNGGSGTITATGSNLRHSSGTVAPNVSTNLTVNNVRLRIKWAGADVTGIATNVIVGQQVALTGEIASGNLSVTKWNWMIPGYAISNFIVSATTNSSQVIELTATNAAQASWYWVSGGAKQVIATATLANGTVVTGKVDFTVLRPSFLIETLTSDIVITNNPGHPEAPYKLQFGSGDLPGVQFRRNFSGNLYGGSLFWAQVMSNQVENFQFTGGCAATNINNALDGSYPYDSSPWTHDTPSTMLQTNLVKYSRQDTFQMYLMYRPPGANTVDVPLSLLRWSWSGLVVKSHGIWELISSTKSVGQMGIDPVSDTSAQFPKWQWIRPSPWVVVYTLGPCP